MCFLTSNTKAQWYMIHLIGNLYLTWEVIPPIIDLLSDPLTQINHNYNSNIIDITIMIHLYHLLFLSVQKMIFGIIFIWNTELS